MKRTLYPGGEARTKGFVLVVCVLLLALLSLFGLTALIQSSGNLTISRNYKGTRQALYAADGGIEYGIARLKLALRSLTPNLSIPSPSLSGFTFNEFSIAPVGSLTQEVLASGPFSGLSSYSTRYEVRSDVRGTDGSAVRIIATMKDILIPLFQFGIFYEQDLEILPGATMAFSGGRIHSNQDIYLNPDGSATLSVEAAITSAGDILHKRKDRSASEGTVRIKDGDDQYQTMTVDSEDADWVTASLDIWDGRVMSQDHGIPQLELPLATDDPTEIIGTGSESLYSKSGLTIVDGVASDKDGNPVTLTYYDPDHTGAPDPGCPEEHNVNPLSTASFYDYREQTTVTVTELNVSKLLGNSNAATKLYDPPEGGDGGILYVSSSTGSIRLSDGASLPSAGLTVASDRPVYIQGDYNTTNNPAAVIADAVTVLSSSWNDANSYSSDLGTRTASSTTVNAAIMGGNKNTSGSQYSGGVENFIRFLENWSGRTLNYSGSLVCLWESRHVTGNWRYGSPVYTAPNRNWAYGMDPSRLPPGTPRVRTLEKISWQQVYPE